MHDLITQLTSKMRLHNLWALKYLQDKETAELEANAAPDRTGVAHHVGRMKYFERLRKEELDMKQNLEQQIVTLRRAWSNLCAARMMKDTTMTLGQLLKETEEQDVHDLVATLRMQTKMVQKDGESLSKPVLLDATEDEVEQFIQKKSANIQKHDETRVRHPVEDEPLQEDRRGTAPSAELG